MIKVENLYKEYVTGKLHLLVLKGINLEVKKGEYVALMGPSGSGKSTFLNLLGLLDNITDGKYLLDNKDVTSLNDNQKAEVRNRKIGFVFQNYNLLSKLNALENVMLPAVYRGTPYFERHKKAEELLEKVGLKDRMKHKPIEMSGGQKQRVAIARSLVNEPKIILADEPTGNLDSKSGDEILRIFKKLNDEGVTIIMVTHEEDVAMCAKRIIRLKDGVIHSDEIVKTRREI